MGLQFKGEEKCQLFLFDAVYEKHNKVERGMVNENIVQEKYRHCLHTRFAVLYNIRRDPSGFRGGNRTVY